MGCCFWDKRAGIFFSILFSLGRSDIAIRAKNFEIGDPKYVAQSAIFGILEHPAGYKYFQSFFPSAFKKWFFLTQA